MELTSWLKRAFKENINVNNMHVHDVAIKDISNSKGHTKQKEGTTHQDISEPSHYMEVLRRDSIASCPAKINKNPKTHKNHEPARQSLLGIKTKPPDPYLMSLVPLSQNTIIDSEGIMEDYGGTVVLKTPGLGM